MLQSEQKSDKMEEEVDDEDEEEFLRASGLVCDLHTAIFRNILHCQLPPSDCLNVANKIRHIGSKQLALAQRVEADGHYYDCDILLMYLLLKSGCPGISPPLAGWGVSPVLGTTLSDDIQRMWDMKCYIVSRCPVRKLEKGKYSELIHIARNICRRLDSDDVRFKIIFAPFPSCVMVLNQILESPLDKAVREMYIQQITHLSEIEDEAAKEKENFARMCRVVMDLKPTDTSRRFG